MVKDNFRFPGPLSDYDNSGIGGFNSVQDGYSSHARDFVANKLEITGVNSKFEPETFDA